MATPYITLDKHHFFYPKSKFVNKWQKLLCLHPYCASMLGKNTEHKWIHITLFEMSVPSSKECKVVTLAIDSWLEANYISLDDSPEEKLRTLIKCFAKINPSVSANLRIQLEVILSFKGE